MTISKKLFVGLITSLSLSACATMPTQIGIENRANIEDAMNKQIVSTEAVKGAPALHPVMSAAAVERYLTDNVKVEIAGGSFSPEE